MLPTQGGLSRWDLMLTRLIRRRHDLALEIEHATSRIAVKRSTDWASPAVKKLDIAKSILITYFWPIDLLIW